ncbi:MAG: hypothetical protein Q4F50_15755 [Bacteroides sp.]|uniref:hypothetical protein n=1 Tax=Bacteroides sp. TaxID=29523 RepID=UPI0026DEED6D|nr:hypothetical protein [Bacteroides sp.]MDO5421498.1 hypothetical protein [Bacteroides sp.]
MNVFKKTSLYFEENPKASYISFACVVLLFRVLMRWWGGELCLEGYDILWMLILTTGFVAGDKKRRKNKAMKDKITNELKNK